MLYHSFFSQQQIDQEYNPRLIEENTDKLIQSYLTESERVSGENTYISKNFIWYFYKRNSGYLFSRNTSQSDTHFFHGGYWHSLVSRYFAFVAEGLLQNGIDYSRVCQPRTLLESHHF